jgi:hypothetical protein
VEETGGLRLDLRAERGDLKRGKTEGGNTGNLAELVLRSSSLLSSLR